MAEIIVDLQQISAEDLTKVGGKGLALGEMAQSGLPVPPGFCLTTTAYTDFIAANGLADFLEQQLGQIDYCRPDSIEAAAQAIRQSILQAPLPDAIEQAVIHNYRDCQPLRDRPLAVRSSAIAEDTATASFAGQHDSFLGVVGESRLLQCIRQCWASLWNARVICYRQRTGFSQIEAALAVVVQLLVPADISGVLFTIDPLSNDPTAMVINATWGLGESVVGGSLEADQITVDRESGAIRDYRCGNKSKYYCLAADHSGITAHDSQQRAMEKCLDRQQVQRLLQLGITVENRKETPQDIEWALWQDRLYLLQTRPITTFAPEQEPEIHWTADNAQEAFPTVVSPYSSSTMFPVLEEQFRRVSHLFGGDLNPQLVCCFDGYAYLNVTAFEQIMAKIIPGVDTSAFVEQILGGGQQGSLQIRITLRTLWPLLKAGRHILTSLLTLSSRARSYQRKFDRLHARFETLPIDGMAANELAALNQRCLRLMSDGFLLHMDGTSAYSLFYGALSEFMGSLPVELGVSPSQLLAGLGTLEDAKLKEGIWRLAQSARKYPHLVELLQRTPPEQMTAAMARLKDSEGFRLAFAEFMQRFGHMGDNLVELLSPSWQHDPTSLWKFLQIQLAAAPTDPRLAMTRMAAGRRRTIHRVTTYLARGWRCFFPFSRWQFILLQLLARFYAPYRENIKFTMTRGLEIFRRIAWRYGAIFCEKGWLATPRQIFFLERREIEAVLAGEADPKSLALLAGQREKQWQLWAQITPAREVYTQGGKVVRKIYDRVDSQAKQLRGVASSAGQVTGKARVILDLRQADRFQAGEILVTRFTDPAWTPLFSLASGIVVDIGSVLSHGAVVARELGIPAVVGVRFASQIIVDGQRITIDGSTGMVWLHDDK